MLAEIGNGVEWWEQWYAAGGDSGPGSRGQAARWKADTVNQFVERNDVRSVFELGCGDGGQLSLLHVPCYFGYDPSKTAIERAAKRFANDASKVFLRDPYGPTSDLTLSMDVFYHLFDDSERELYLFQLFAAARRFVLIYTTRDSSHDFPGHVWHRPPPDGWIERIDNPDPSSNCSFFVYAVGQA